MNHPIQVIAVTGGKGGVGKTTLSVNLGLALVQIQRRVMLLDADLGLAGVDILLGLNPTKTLENVLLGDSSLNEIVINGPGGMVILPKINMI